MQLTTPEDYLLEDLLSLDGGYLKAYRAETVLCGIRQRMRALQAPNFHAYVQRSMKDPDEYPFLVEAALNHTTWFFRDPESWQKLHALLVAAGMGSSRAHRSGRAVRAWCAGCSSGQEAYTLGAVLAEALGPGAIERARLRVFATDQSERHIKAAREGRYPEAFSSQIPVPFSGSTSPSKMERSRQSLSFGASYALRAMTFFVTRRYAT